MPSDWHTRLEKRVIREFGGTPTDTYGPDGTLDGAPVEVRAAREDSRLRLNKETHQELLNNNGTYLFEDVTDDVPPRQVSAERVDRALDSGPWFSDRGYKHKFLSAERATAPSGFYAGDSDDSAGSADSAGLFDSGPLF